MCEYCVETFRIPNHIKLHEEHYPLLESIPINLVYILSNTCSFINEDEKLKLFKSLETLIQEFKQAPDTKLIFLNKEKLKLKL